MLVVGGLTRLNQPVPTQLVWALAPRFAGFTLEHEALLQEFGPPIAPLLGEVTGDFYATHDNHPQDRPP